MKWSVRWFWQVAVVLSSILLSVDGFGQGAVYLKNHVPGILDAPITDLTGTNALTGVYAVLVQFGKTPGVWEASYSVGLEEGGYFASPFVPELTFAEPGATVFAQVVVYPWIFSSYEAAATAASPIAESEVIQVKLGPRWDPGLLTGLKPFHLHYPPLGTIDFRNRVPGLLDAPVLDTNGVPLSGTGFVAQVYAKVATNQFTEMVPVGAPAPFGTGEAAGYWQPGPDSTLVLTNIAAGQIAQIQVLVWESAKGASYAEAAHAQGKRGQSALLTVATGGVGTPPTAPGVLTGLSSFQVGGPAPGTILFQNRVPGLIDQPLRPWFETSLVSAPFVAQLWVNGLAASEVAPFGTGPDAGYWRPSGDGVVSLPNIQSGEAVLAELKVWDGSQAASYAQAQQGAIRGTVGPVQVRTGGAGIPPSAPGLLDALLRYPVDLRGGLHAAFVDFRNFIPGRLDEPVMGPDGKRVSGGSYVAQLYGQPDDRMQLAPLSPPAPFGIGDQAGYWQPGDNTIYQADINAGCCATFQVRVWDASKAATFEEAGIGNRAMSRRIWFFGGQTGVLQNIGPISLVRRYVPRLMLQQNVYREMFLDVDFATRLSGPSYVAQLFIAKGGNATNNFQPAAPPAPLGSGDKAGSWNVPPDFAVDLPNFAPGEYGTAMFKVWDAATGATYDEAIAHNGLVGTGGQVNFIANNLEEPPAVADFSYSYIYLQGRVRKISAPPGLSLLGNPFARGAYYSNILPTPPDGAMVYVFNPFIQSYQITTAVAGTWNARWLQIDHGAGFFFYNPTPAPLDLTFQGVEGKLTFANPTPQKDGFLCLANTRETPASVAELVAVPLQNGDSVFRFNNGQWSISQFDNGQWSTYEPILQPGEAVFVRLTARP